MNKEITFKKDDFDAFLLNTKRLILVYEKLISKYGLAARIKERGEIQKLYDTRLDYLWPMELFCRGYKIGKFEEKRR